MPVKPKTAFLNPEVIGLCRRFVKNETLKIGIRDQKVIFYKVYALYPDEKFWRNYKLDFMLNSWAYFLTEEGLERLKTDYALFHLDIAPKNPYNVETEKVDEDVKVVKPRKTTSDLFK